MFNYAGNNNGICRTVEGTSRGFIGQKYRTNKTRSKKERTFAIKILLLILQHFKHSLLQSSPLYWRYTVPNVSSIVGIFPGTHFL